LTGKRKALVAPPLLGVLAFVGMAKFPMLTITYQVWLVACAIALDGPFNDTTTAPIPVENGKIFLTRWDTAATGVTLRFGSISCEGKNKRINIQMGQYHYICNRYEHLGRDCGCN